MRILLFLAAAIVMRAAERSPVLVELFTSEGCSSCPPADALLARLEKSQPVAEAEIIVLSEHVDYWNRLGWRDPFSSVEFTLRQQRYTEGFRRDGAYTPQMVVDGRVEFVGSDERQALSAIASAARQPKAKVEIDGSAGRPVLRIRVTDLPKGSGKADVMLATTESDLESNVSRGENAGRKLAHTSVVRRMSAVGKLDGQPFSSDVAVTPDKSWKQENVHAVVFVEERGSHRILGAGYWRCCQQ